MKRGSGLSSSGKNQGFRSEQLNWKIPGIILSLLLLVVAMGGIFISYFFTGPRRLKYGFIDSAGNIIVEPEYESVEQYDNNLARFRKNGRYGFLNRNGEVVFAPKFTSISQKNKQLAVGLVETNLRIMKRDGNLLEPTFIEVGDITQTPIRVKTNAGWGLLDPEGTYLLKPNFDRLDPFEGKQFTTIKKNSKFGIINQTGDVLLETEYDGVEFISDTLLWLNRAGLHGLARGGEILIEPEYTDKKSFSEGFAAVRRDRKWGLINEKGQEVVKPQFEDVATFSGGRARIGVFD